MQIKFDLIVFPSSYSEIMSGGRQGLVQYLKPDKEEVEMYIEVERMKGRHNKAVWHRVAKKQIKKTRFEDVLERSNLG